MSNVHPANPSDSQIHLINSNGLNRAPAGLPAVTFGYTDPVKVNVEFSWNDQKQLLIDGPTEPGYGHLQRPPRRLATEKDKQLFAPQYHLFLTNQNQFKTGTLLDLIIKDKATLQDWYKAGIYNIETAANTGDNVFASHPKLDPEVKKLAQRWTNHKLHEQELEARDSEIARLLEENSQLRIKLEDKQRIRTKI